MFETLDFNFCQINYKCICKVPCNWGVHGRVFRVVDLDSLAPLHCVHYVFESRQGLLILSCEEVIQLAYGSSVVLLRCLLVLELIKDLRSSSKVAIQYLQLLVGKGKKTLQLFLCFNQQIFPCLSSSKNNKRCVPEQHNFFVHTFQDFIKRYQCLSEYVYIGRSVGLYQK